MMPRFSGGFKPLSLLYDKEELQYLDVTLLSHLYQES